MTVTQMSDAIEQILCNGKPYVSGDMGLFSRLWSVIWLSSFETLLNVGAGLGLLNINSQSRSRAKFMIRNRGGLAEVEWEVCIYHPKVVFKLFG